MDYQKTKNIVEGALLAAAKPLSLNQLDDLFDLADRDHERPSRDQIRQALKELQADYENRGMEIKQVGSGFRVQVRQDYEMWIGRLWEEKPPRYSRALLETLSIIAYRQPVTRSEIENIRGVAVSTNITRTLQEREWVRVVGHRDVPGKPAMFGTTKEFLDYFNLKNLDEMPTLAELRDLDAVNPELDLEGQAESDATSTKVELEVVVETATAEDEPAAEAVAELESTVPQPEQLH